MPISGLMTILGGAEGIAFVKTPYANLTDDWPDIEIHFISSSPSSDGGGIQSIRKVMGLNDHVSCKQLLFTVDINSIIYHFSAHSIRSYTSLDT